MGHFVHTLTQCYMSQRAGERERERETRTQMTINTQFIYFLSVHLTVK